MVFPKIPKFKTKIDLDQDGKAMNLQKNTKPQNQDPGYHPLSNIWSEVYNVNSP